MKTSWPKQFVNYSLIQILPVTLGVLLGLLLSQWNENSKEKALAQSALEGIRQEVMQNQIRIDNALIYHKALLKKVGNNPDQAVISLGITSTLNGAWAASQRTSLSNFMYYETYLILAEIYDFQREYQQMNDAAGSAMIMSNVMLKLEERFSTTWKQGWRGTLESWIYLEKALSEKYKNALSTINDSTI